MRLQGALFIAWLGLATPALAQQDMPQMAPTMNTASPADQAFMKSMTTMDSVMTKPLSGDADQDFTRLMLAHHQAAVDMAKDELKYGKNKFLRKLSIQIIATQSAEIRQMHAWQAEHPLATK